MTAFATLVLSEAGSVTAPDGIIARPLLALAGGSFVAFELTAGATSRAVTHRSVEEIWFVTAGRGEIWRSQDGREEITALEPGVCITLPLRTAFQVRATEDLVATAITMPPWPGEDEAVAASGPWPATT